MAYPIGLNNLDKTIQLEDEIADDEIIDANIFSGQEDFIFKSIISAPSYSFDIGEPRDLEGSFQYNYFVRNESNPINPDNLQSIIKTNISNMLYEANNIEIGKIPRFVRVNFKKPLGAEILNQINPVVQAAIDNNLLTFEGASSSTYYTGLEIYDMDLGSKLYSGFEEMLRIYRTYNPSNETISEEPLPYTHAKKILLDAITSSKAKPVSVSGISVDPEKSVKSLDYSNISHSIKCNNFLLNDIFNRATRLPIHAFSNEIEAATSSALQITQNMLQTVDPATITEAELSAEVETIEGLTEDGNNEVNNYSIKIAGYLVKKYEVTPSGDLKMFKTFKLGKDQTSFADPNVRYGMTYLYKIHTICQVIAPLLVEDDENQNEYKYYRFLIASEGKNVNIECIENVSPPPPAAVNVRFNYKRKIPRLVWQFPVNPQRDIIGFQIFRRLSVDQPYTLCAEYNFHPSGIIVDKPEQAQSKNLYKLPFAKLDYEDVKFQEGTNPIYAVASVDAHGLTSNLSSQMSFKYNKFLNTTKVVLISREGAPKPYPNLYIEKDTFLDCIKTSNYDRMTVFFDPEYCKVFKNIATGNEKNGESTKEKDLNLIAANEDNPTYKIHIMNIDLQKDRTVDIRIVDKHQPLTESSLEETVTATGVLAASSQPNEALPNTTPSLAAIPS